MNETRETKTKSNNKTTKALTHQLFLIASIREKHPIYNSIDLSGHSRSKIVEMYKYLVLDALKN